MDAIYARGGQATAEEVHAAIEDAPSPTGVRTMMRLLELKGHLTHRKQGRQYVYVPTRARKAVGQSALRRVLRTFFDDSFEIALAAHLADHETLSDEELDRLAKVIRDAKKKGASK